MAIPRFFHPQYCETITSPQIFSSRGRIMETLTVQRGATDAIQSPMISRIGKGDLRRLFSDWEIVARLLPILEIPLGTSIDRPFTCVLPGHTGHTARLSRNRHGVIVYRDEELRLEMAVYTLADVFRIRCTGLPSKMWGPTLAAWNLRLLAEAGTLEPVHVDLPPLSKSSSRDTRKVYKGLMLLFGVRWRFETGIRPVPFSYRFAASWCGVSEHAASEAIKKLLRLDIVHIASHAPGPFGKPMALFMPGSGRRVNRIRHRALTRRRGACPMKRKTEAPPQS